jgi:F-type H+-transporting ATPase subunit b
MHIDWWTLALQTVNVLILIWILARFFFRPVMDIVAARQQQADKLLDDAASVRQQAADARGAAEKARAEIVTEREKLIAEARNAALTEKQMLLAQSREEIAKGRSEAETAIVRDRAAAEEAIIDRASNLSIDIAQRLLARFPHQSVLYAFIDATRRELLALSPDSRESLASTATTEHPIAIVTAAPLSDEEMTDVRAALAKAFDRELPIAFETDPAILNGIELRGQNTIIRNSWRADLERIRQELIGDKNARQS